MRAIMYSTRSPEPLIHEGFDSKYIGHISGKVRDHTGMENLTDGVQHCTNQCRSPAPQSIICMHAVLQ